MKRLSFLVLILAAHVVHAQTASTGVPYFQQRVQYLLEATFHDDLSSPSITGTGSLDYTNNSPDSLSDLYFHLYWNLFTHGSYGESAPNRDHSEDQGYGHGGITVSTWLVSRAGEAVPARITIDNTVARLTLDRSIAPGETYRISFEWSGILPNYGIRSTWGFHDNAARNFATAQWYPQICVYDNFGWHPDQYVGMGEFYTDYGSFDVTLNMPQRFGTVVSTGYQTNLSELKPQYAERLEFARSHPDSVVRVVDNSSFTFKPIQASEPLVKWMFHADSVRDFAWAADEAYIWDAIYHNGILHHALYWDGSRPLWETEGAKLAEFTISHNSRVAGQYLYPNAYLCETYEGGMEYPGIVFIGPYSDPRQHWAQNTMMHELGHEWYPMMMGSNETDYGYMDEGFNTFLTTLTHEAYFGRYNNAGEGSHDDERTANYREAIVQQLSGYQEPTRQKADMYQSYRNYANATYPHTGSVFFMLRYVMGETAFSHFLHLYYDRWHLKHPYPDDLLNAANDVERVEGDTNRVRSRGDLRWFFDEWFDKTWTLDYAIEDFSVRGTTASVTIARKGRAVMPLDLVFQMWDGTTVQKWIPVDDWLRTVADQRTYTFDFTNPPLSVRINPTNELLDDDRLNNASGLLPPITLDMRLKNLLPSPHDPRPIDAYEFRLAPWIGPASVAGYGGASLGLTLQGSYLDVRDRMAIGPRIEHFDLEFAGSKLKIGGVLQYHTVLDAISPFSDLDIALADIGHEQIVIANYAHVVTQRGDPTPIHIFGGGYALTGDLFGTTSVPLNRLFGNYTYHFENGWDEFSMGGQFEAGVGDPRTTYTKLSGVMNDWVDLGKTWSIYLRGFAGTMQPIKTPILPEVLFNLGGASASDRVVDVYTTNMGSDLRSKIRNLAMSGPMVRAYSSEIGRVATSATFELNTFTLSPSHLLHWLALGAQYLPFIGPAIRPTAVYAPRIFDLSIFGDAGLVTNAFCTCSLKSELRSDFGLGVKFNGFGSRTDRDLHMDFDRSEFRLDVPLWMSHPDDGKARWAPRLVAVVRQNF